MKNGKNIVLNLGWCGLIFSWGTWGEFLDKFKLQQRRDFYDA